MSTYGTMQTRIADEIKRTDLTSQIQLAILSAVNFYKTDRFWWNESRSDASTVADQEYYGLPADFLALDFIGVTVSSRYYQLVPKSAHEIDEINWGAGTYTGYPAYFALYENNLRLYPIPNAVYTLRIAYLKQLTALSASADSNEWTVTAEELIRLHAKADLLENVIRGPEAVGESQALRFREREVYSQVRFNADLRRSSGRLRVSGW